MSTETARTGAAHAPPIAAHRLLGDGQATALLRPGGEVDWWCAPSMDSPPLLWSLLDARGAASRWVGVRAMSHSGHAAGSALTTVLQTSRGRVECLDGLLREGDDHSSLVRLVRGVDADLNLQHELGLGGFDLPWADWQGEQASLPGLRLRLLGANGQVVTGPTGASWWRGRVQAPRDTWAGLCLTLDPDRAGGPMDWLEACRVNMREDDEFLEGARMPSWGRHRVEDALRVLRQCTFTQTGAVVASPTTSLPEAPGHDRQFDYRYTWLRDASLAMSVAAQLGRSDMASRYLDFVVDQTASRVMPSGPMTDLRGKEVPPERTVEGVAGWGGSLPVRVGNGASEQRQYDAFGLLLESVAVYLQQGGSLTRPVWSLVRDVADELAADGLSRSTSGIWELREPADLVSADIGVWIALDRAISIARWRRPWTRTAGWKAARARAKDRVVGALQEDGGLPQAHGDGPRSADASALMAVIFRLFDQDDPRASRLVDATLARLDVAPFLYRYEPAGAVPPLRDDGFGGTEGAFLPTSWWVVSALANCGRVDEARERALALDAALPALLPEEIDPESRQGLGNTPLVWSHMEAARAMYLLDAATFAARHGRVVLQLRRVLQWVQSRRSRRARAQAAA